MHSICNNNSDNNNYGDNNNNKQQQIADGLSRNPASLLDSSATYVRKVPKLNVLQTNQEYLASSVSTGISGVIHLQVLTFHVQTCTAARCSDCIRCFCEQSSCANGRQTSEH
jgi:hypothetical protein